LPIWLPLCERTAKPPAFAAPQTARVAAKAATEPILKKVPMCSISAAVPLDTICQPLPPDAFASRGQLA
jgi:hypothetical protein